MKRYWVILIVLTMGWHALATTGQSLPDTHETQGGGVTAFIRKVGTLIDSMSVSGVDRRYIDAPEKPWQFIVRGNVNQSSLKMKASGNIGSVEYSATPFLKTEPFAVLLGPADVLLESAFHH